MTEFSYRARNNAGDLVTGNLEAASEQDVLKQLRGMHYTPVRVSPGAGRLPGKDTARTAVSVPVRPVAVYDMMTFSTNFATMVNAGIPLLGALKSVSRQLTNLYFRDVVSSVAQKVSEGSSLSAAMEEHSRIFSRFFCTMVRVGEMSGTMDSVLGTLSRHMEKQENLQQRIKSALVYPAVLVTAGSAVIMIILTMVMPRFVEVFTRAGVPLPLPTRLMYTTGVWLQHYWWLLLLILGGSFAGIKMVLRTRTGKNVLDRFFLKLPVLGPLICHAHVVRFTRTLGAMLGAGVPINQALDVLKGLMDNAVFAGIVQEVLTSVEMGEGLHKPLLKRAEFPQDAAYMISVGEETGMMPVMLNKVADYYENKVNYVIQNLLVFIEPALISLLGVIVGIMLASVLLPMFDMVKTIQR